MAGNQIRPGALEEIRSAETLSAANEIVALAVRIEQGDMSAASALARRSDDSEVFAWVFAFLEESRTNDVLASTISDDLTASVETGVGLIDRVSEFVCSPASTPGCQAVRGSLLNALVGEEQVTAARLVLESANVTDELRAVAIECLARTRDLNNRADALLAAAEMGTTAHVRALAALSRPLLAGEQADVVARLKLLVQSVSTDPLDPPRVAGVLSRLTPRAAAEVLRCNWNRQFLDTTISAGELARKSDDSGQLIRLLGYELPDAVRLAIVKSAVEQLSTDRMLEIGVFVCSTFNQAIVAPIVSYFAQLAMVTNDDRTAADAVLQSTLGCKDEEVAVSIGKALSAAGFRIVFDAAPIKGKGQSFRMGLAAGGLLVAAEGTEAEDVLLELGLPGNKSSNTGEFWRGMLDSCEPDSLSDSLAMTAVSYDAAIRFLADREPTLLARAARASVDAERRVRVVELGFAVLSTEDLEELRPHWSNGNAYGRFWRVAARADSAELVSTELRRALMSRSGPQAASIQNEQLKDLLDSAIDARVHRVPDGVEDAVRRLLSDSDDDLVSMTCAWIGGLDDPSPALIEAVVGADEARARPVTALGGLRQHLAQARLARVLDQGLENTLRADALDDVKQLDGSIAWDASVQLFEQDPLPPDEIRAAAAEVLASTEGDMDRMALVASFADREHITAIQETLQRAADGSGGATEVLTDQRTVFISYVHEDAEMVDLITRAFDEAGISYWRDRQDLGLGVRWKAAIRTAVRNGSLFLACFSSSSERKERSYMREEITIAIEQIRLRPTDRAWFIPAKLEPCEIPDRDIGAGETLGDIQFISLFEDWDRDLQMLVSEIVRIQSSSP